MSLRTRIPISRGGAVSLLVAIPCVALATTCIVGRSKLLPHFRTVRPGILYRSGQPRGVGLEILHLKGIRTLVNLRRPGRPGIAEEIRFASEHGMRFVQLPLGNRDVDIAAAADQFLALVRDPHNWPVLVHCSRGKERSGVMAAAFRVEEDGWSPERALKELFALGLEPGTMPQAEDFVRELPMGDVPVASRDQVLPKRDWID